MNPGAQSVLVMLIMYVICNEGATCYFMISAKWDNL